MEAFLIIAESMLGFFIFCIFIITLAMAWMDREDARRKKHSDEYNDDDSIFHKR